MIERFDLKKYPQELRRAAGWFLAVAFILIAGISTIKYVRYVKEKARRLAEIKAGPRVHIAFLKNGPGEHKDTLIGETRPYQSATLYAKISGYLKSVKVDKGDVVKKNQVLAVIESAETDEAYFAAEADANNKKAIFDRMASLYAKQLVSQQEYDQARTDSDVATAKLRAEKTLKGYETLRAPFDGTITARYADPGALVQNAASSDAGSLPVLMIADVTRLRVDVFIDQRDAPYVQKDDPVTITLPDRPGFQIDGQVARVSDELDPRTKMLLIEIDIPNKDESLVAGSFVQVAVDVKSPSYLQAPVEALVLMNNKSYLTMVTDQNTLTYREITVGSNDGEMLTVLKGAKDGERVALNLGNSLPEGSHVRPIGAAAHPPVPASTQGAHH